MRKLTKKQVDIYNKYIYQLEKEDNFKKIINDTNVLFDYIDTIKEFVFLSTSFYKASLKDNELKQNKIKDYLIDNKNRFNISFSINLLQKEHFFYFEIIEIQKERIITKRKNTRTNAKIILKHIQNILFLEDKIFYEKEIRKIHNYISTKKDLEKNILEEIKMPEIKNYDYRVNKIIKNKKVKYKAKDKLVKIKSKNINTYIKEFNMLSLTKSEVKKRKEDLIKRK